MQENIIDILLDEENRDSIVLTDDKGRKLAFEQVAIIPYDEKLYCVLKPIDHIEGIAEDEALVFYVDEGENEDDEPVLRIENDELKSIDVFMKYYDLLDEEAK